MKGIYQVLSWVNCKKQTKSWITKTAEEPLLSFLKNELKGYKSVLDIACGDKSPLLKIPKKFYLEGIDIYTIKPTRNVYDAYKKGDIRNIRKYYKKKSFDVAVLLDVIEHLTHPEGERLLKDLEYIARDKIIILTPNGFIYQGEVDDNPFQKHLSGWTSKDFVSLGYKTYGMHGIKILRGAQAGIKFKPWYIWLFISNLTQYITFFFPKLAYHLIAVKALNLY